jgi:UDP-glucose 4-epimerase
MTSPHVLITGGYGCIGSETAKWLLRHTTANVIICSRHVSEQRTERVFHDVNRSRLKAIAVDIRHQAELAAILRNESITHVAHLAAMQTPECNAHRDLGLQTNLAATQYLIEAMKEASTPIQRFLFASSIAVYGPRPMYPVGRVPMLADPHPVNVYGVWKLASEHIARLFHQETGIPTVCLRPGVLYGPGRDIGLTSSPTTAMKCIALGIPYEVTFRTQQDYLYAADAGTAFAHTLIDPFDGYGVFTMPSHTANTDQMVEWMRVAANDLGIGSQFHITIGSGEAPFICELDFEPFSRAFPGVPNTPLQLGVRESLSVFLQHAQRGWLTDKMAS